MVNDIVPAALEDPASLFIALWLVAEQWGPSERNQALACHQTFTSLLAEPDAAVLCRFGRDCLAQYEPDSAGRGKILALMRAIDDCFYAIHPRCVTLPGGSVSRLSVPAWLKSMKARRQQEGGYAEYRGKRLVARGPLTRECRTEDAASADTLADRFAALAVVPTLLEQDGRKIVVRHKVVLQSALHGMMRQARPGKETVAVIPLAQAADDLALRGSMPNGKYLLDVRPKTGWNPVERLAKGLEQLAACDIAVCPEFVMPETHAREVPAMLQSLVAAPALLVAGSGVTELQGNGGLAWNESCIFNRYGVNLWRQRKLWPASMPHWRADGYGVKFGDCLDVHQAVPVSAQVMEATDSGSELVVVDMDGLGRCAVLICQDIKGSPLASELVRCFQPDWVFVPILDDGIRAGNWVHQSTFALSQLAQTRYVVASSISLAQRSQRASQTHGYALAIAPLTSSDDPEENRRMLLAGSLISNDQVSVALIDWGQTSDWQRSTLDGR